MSYNGCFGECCGTCTHFLTACFTVSDLDKEMITSRYANVVVGECNLPKHAFDPEHTLSGVEHLRWATHVSCQDYDSSLCM